MRGGRKYVREEGRLQWRTWGAEDELGACGLAGHKNRQRGLLAVVGATKQHALAQKLKRDELEVWQCHTTRVGVSIPTQGLDGWASRWHL